jgi:hypothetical protein
MEWESVNWFVWLNLFWSDLWKVVFLFRKWLAYFVRKRIATFEEKLFSMKLASK